MVIFKKRIDSKKHPFINDIITNRSLWLMLTPVLLFFVIFRYIPLTGIILAFKDYNVREGVFGSPWTGLENFMFMIKSGVLFTITRNTILYNIVFIFFGNFVQIVIAIMLSELVFRRLKKISQSIMILPHFISFVILGVFIYNLFNYEYGALNGILKEMGKEEVDVYSMTNVWKYILVFFQTWKTIGYGSVIYIATITNIDGSLYEASDIDGASIFQKIFHITIPMLKPTVAILILLAFGRIMRGQFELFYNIVGDNSQLFATTDIIDTYVFRSLTHIFDPGMGTAAGFYQSVVGLVFVVVANYSVKKLHEEYALF